MIHQTLIFSGIVVGWPEASLGTAHRSARLRGNYSSQNLQGGGVFSVAVGLYDDLHVVIEGDEEAQKAPLHEELAEVAAQQLGEIIHSPRGLKPG